MQLLGTYDFNAFSESTTEFWHGLTVGVSGGLPSTEPVPTSALVLGPAVGVLALRRRRR